MKELLQNHKESIKDTNLKDNLLKKLNTFLEH